jgi:hypothetical protein
LPRPCGADSFLTELIWREFYILYHFPGARGQSFRAEARRIRWREDEEGFGAWCAGRTGYPVVDAGMREFAETGLLHDRARMMSPRFSPSTFSSTGGGENGGPCGSFSTAILPRATGAGSGQRDPVRMRPRTFASSNPVPQERELRQRGSFPKFAIVGRNRCTSHRVRS